MTALKWSLNWLGSFSLMSAAKEILVESFKAALIDSKQSSNMRHFAKRRSDCSLNSYSSRTLLKRRNGGNLAKFASETSSLSLPINAPNPPLKIKLAIINFSLWQKTDQKGPSRISKRRKGISQNQFSTKWWKRRPTSSNLVSLRRSPNWRISNKTSEQSFK